MQHTTIQLQPGRTYTIAVDQAPTSAPEPAPDRWWPPAPYTLANKKHPWPGVRVNRIKVAALEALKKPRAPVRATEARKGPAVKPPER